AKVAQQRGGLRRQENEVRARPQHLPAGWPRLALRNNVTGVRIRCRHRHSISLRRILRKYFMGDAGRAIHRGLTRRAIVERALELGDAEGLEAVSLRRLA